jgi:hypothetical protein
MNYSSLDSHTKSLSLIAGTALQATCSGKAPGNDPDFKGSLTVVHPGQTQIDGTSFAGISAGNPIQFVRNGALTDGFATVNLHLIVTVPGAVFTIDGVIETNADQRYCRISALVDSAIT